MGKLGYKQAHINTQTHTHLNMAMTRFNMRTLVNKIYTARRTLGRNFVLMGQSGFVEFAVSTASQVRVPANKKKKVIWLKLDNDGVMMV